MVDLKCDGTPTTAKQGKAYLIIYGIKGNHSDVPADVYDKAFIFENNKMVMGTDLDMNNHDIVVKNPTKDDNSVNLGYLKGLETFITGAFHKHKNPYNIYFNIYDYFQIIPCNCLLKSLTCCFDYVENNPNHMLTLDLFIKKRYNSNSSL